MKLPTVFATSVALAITPLVSAITPEGMLAAPRRSELIPNPTGEWGVFTSTNYSWTTHKSHTVWNLMNLTSGAISLLYDGADIAEMVWVGPESTSVIYVNGTNEEDDGGVSLYSADVTAIENAALVASLPAAYSGMKAVRTTSGDIHFLVNSLSYPNGTVYNEQLADVPYSTARIYTSIYVRHWDHWLSPQTYAVFGGVLSASGNGSYSFDGEMTNYVTGIKNVTTAETPVQPFGGSGDYDISPDGSQVIFLTKNVDLPLANFTNSIIYHVPFNGTYSSAQRINSWDNAPVNAHGASAAPTFSHNGEYIGYLQMDGVSYESDRAKVYIASSNPANWNITALAENWDRGPDALQWDINDTSLVVGTPDHARERLFVVPITAGADYKPANITDEGHVNAYFAMPNGNWLVTSSYIWSSADMFIVSPEGQVINTLLQANEVDAALAGLGPEDVSEFYFQGNFTEVQSFIVYPEGFSENETYPLAFLVHGGPQSPWFNAWSTRWNMKVWADQGYVVIAPNPTASPGWGQAFVDAVQNNWGSYPYDDLVKCWEYVDANLSYIDTENGIAAGASYGGYMINWIQGHDLGRKFKALVTHDGSTNTNNQYSSEELWFMQHDFNGTLWDDRDNYERWNPINHITEWATPHFVVHSSMDYRLPEAEGITLFNVLQERGVPSKFLNFPDENHWVLKRENSIVWHTEIYKWINYYSGISNASSPY